MPKPTATQCHAMTTYFVSKYNEVVGKPVVVNRNKARWGWEGLLTDFSTAEAKALVDYYLESYNSQSIDWFLYNYEKVVDARQEHEEQEAQAVKRREATAARLEEWRNRWKNQTP